MIETCNGTPKENRHVLGLLAGIGIGLVVGAILAGISIVLETEVLGVVIGGLVLVGLVVSRFLPNKSVMGFITRALACGITYLFYTFILIWFWYWYADGNWWFWLLLIGSIIYGGLMGYNGREFFENETTTSVLDD